MKKITAVIAVLLLLNGCASGSQSAKYRQISSAEAQAMMQQETDYIILDVRTEQEYAGGHIPDALNIPVESIGSQDLPLLPQKDQRIMVYCRSGNRSKKAAEKLAALGYTNVVEFGGINSWEGPVTAD